MTASLARLAHEDLLQCWPAEALTTAWARLAHAVGLVSDAPVPQAGSLWPPPRLFAPLVRGLAAALYAATGHVVAAPGQGE